MLNYLGYLAYKLGEAITVRLSERGAYRLARGIAWLYWVLHRRARATLTANMRQVLAWVAEGQLNPRLHATFALDDIRAAIGVLDRREAVGKVVLTL